MFGLRIRKTIHRDGARLWPTGYHSLNVLLKPAAEQLRPLWWLLPRAHLMFHDPADETLADRLSSHLIDVDGTPSPVATPGFLPDFGSLVSGDWSLLYGIPDAIALDKPRLAELTPEHIGWFDPPTTFPLEVSVVIRGIDWGYWDLFARDERIIDSIRAGLCTVEGLSLEKPE